MSKFNLCITWCAPFGYLYLFYFLRCKASHAYIQTSLQRQDLNPRLLSCKSLPLITKPCLLAITMRTVYDFIVEVFLQIAKVNESVKQYQIIYQRFCFLFIYLFLVCQDAFVPFVLSSARSSGQPKSGSHPAVGDADDHQGDGVLDDHLEK